MAKQTSTKSNGKTSQCKPASMPSDSRSHRAADSRRKPNTGNGSTAKNKRGTKSRKRAMYGMPMNASGPSKSKKQDQPYRCCDQFDNQARHGCSDRREEFGRGVDLDAVDEQIIDAAIAHHAADVLGDFAQDSEGSRDPQLEALARRLQKCKMEKGIAQANRDWLDEPFEEWNDNLRNHVHSMSEEHALAICVAMADMLSSRDALIMSLVGANQAKVGVKAMLDLAAEPHDPANVIRLYRLLDAAFNDADASPDLERCVCGIDMLADMAQLVCGRFEVQPLTVAAYGSWWVGSDDALDYAREALCLDEQCTLARIICSAINQGLRPAWRM
ncbi:hypothetical protein OZX62_06650 [Bifidobacterium sp. ESL0690]|uniref:hypothetical protein n=1 Tax=Bifidobacterium sp. ESL0690 TaxID=2983214 RepID=UPI0023F801B7|nr:hypothetical protein [Bifidobacterium sp. ESL0690]WEV46134.1 hypothetical protein OZX62_06650 [Bifidobacterium sp. ESL0690]